MGNLKHRTKEQADRIKSYINQPKDSIKSCYYHIGRTSNKSIFFISDAIPITEKYIAEEHLSADQSHYVIKNTKLIAELERKLLRILSYENARNNYFRQHITDVKWYLLKELYDEKQSLSVNPESPKASTGITASGSSSS